MDTLDEALRARIDELAGSDKGRQPILSTTGTQVAIAELIARNDRLERAGQTARQVSDNEPAAAASASRDGLRIAMLAPISWRVPPRHYGPWEQFVSLLTEGLVRRGVDVTLFATADSVTGARLVATAPTGYSEDPGLSPGVVRTSG